MNHTTELINELRFALVEVTATLEALADVSSPWTGSATRQVIASTVAAARTALDKATKEVV